MAMLKTIKTSMTQIKEAQDGIKASMDGLKKEVDVLKGNMERVQEQMKDKPAKFKASLAYLKLGAGDVKASIGEIKQGVTLIKDAGKDREPAAQQIAGAELIREQWGFKLKRGGDAIGEIHYAEGPDPDIWLATHTYVEPEYRGGDVAKTLLNRLVEEARMQGKRIFPACSYVRAQFKRDAAYEDVWHEYR
ncbi:hypothetical protein CDO73_02430 [Saccharibacillus sp. O23]|uniref:GNAT family N-acetyltransferase n=1 Tax=Saccharibacillus sp. O23 TaxID=2009338 RepID=UPI000B4E7167|nr:GNAT family N-acetyltransferase [Saccharibacillus sp. O23]OWR32480.1 hypothetical protein CDO73_02430 [Saccharibacillus sp. O23]